MQKKLSKREERRQKYLEMQKKQVEKAFKYPFCRRCKSKLQPEWAKKLKKRMAIPLCPVCFKPMMEQFKRNVELWQKFKAR